MTQNQKQCQRSSKFIKDSFFATRDRQLKINEDNKIASDV